MWAVSVVAVGIMAMMAMRAVPVMAVRTVGVVAVRGMAMGRWGGGWGCRCPPASSIGGDHSPKTSIARIVMVRIVVVYSWCWWWRRAYAGDCPHVKRTFVQLCVNYFSCV